MLPLNHIDTLLHDFSALEDVDKVGCNYLGQIVCGYDGGLVRSPAFDSFEETRTREVASSAGVASSKSTKIKLVAIQK